MYLMCDFSNAVRKAFTSIKKAELLGGMGKPKKIITEAKIPQYVQDMNKKFIKDSRLDKKEMAKRRLSYANTPQEKKEAIELLKQSNTVINRQIKERLPQKAPTSEKVGYVDAIQKARYGKTKPIKSDNVISRSGLLQNPQDNTVLSAAQEKVVNATRKDKLQREYGLGLLKDNPKTKLKTTKLSKGASDELSIDMGDITNEAFKKRSNLIGTVHSHPNQPNKYMIPKRSDRVDYEAWTVKPSVPDFNVASTIDARLKGDKGINIINSVNEKTYYPKSGRQRITKKDTKKSGLRTNTVYNSDSPINAEEYKTRGDLRKISRNKANYTVTTSNKNQ